MTNLMPRPILMAGQKEPFMLQLNSWLNSKEMAILSFFGGAYRPTQLHTCLQAFLPTKLTRIFICTLHKRTCFLSLFHFGNSCAFAYRHAYCRATDDLEMHMDLHGHVHRQMYRQVHRGIRILMCRHVYTLVGRVYSVVCMRA